MSKKKLALVLSGILLLTSLSGCTSSSDEAELAENERYAYAVVTSIEGNEITYMEVEESQVISTKEETEDKEESEIPSRGEMPSGGEMPSEGEMPSGDSKMDVSNIEGTAVNVQIPVGVTVHTAADTETTFSRIAAGDVLKLLLETDEDGNEVITEIWMIEQ